MTGIEQWLLPKLGFKSPPWTLHHSTPDHLNAEARGRVPADRLPEARRQAHLRPALQRVHQQHQSRRKTSRRTLTLEGLPSVPVAHQPGEIRRAGRAVTARLPSTSSSNDGGTEERLQINAQNCVHCKTCDIKDPTQNIVLGHARRRRRARTTSACDGHGARGARSRSAIGAAAVAAGGSRADRRAHPAWASRAAHEDDGCVQCPELLVARLRRSPRPRRRGRSHT